MFSNRLVVFFASLLWASGPRLAPRHEVPSSTFSLTDEPHLTASPRSVAYICHSATLPLLS